MILIKNIPITFVENLTEYQIEQVINSPKLMNYINKNLENKNVEIKSIRIDKVNFFGNNIGFIYLESKIFVNKKQVPGIAFLRGDSVAILLVLKTFNTIKNKNEKYTILVEQYRSNEGGFVKELPAGMIDIDGEVTSTAIKEIEEEVGNINITEKKLLFLTKYFPSSGGCDETMYIYAAEIEIDFKKLMSFQDRITGAVNENEIIKLDVIPFEEIKDNYGMKSEIAVLKYNTLLKKSYKNLFYIYLSEFNLLTYIPTLEEIQKKYKENNKDITDEEIEKIYNEIVLGK